MTTATLFDLLADHRISVKSYHPGYQQHVNCPFCLGGRKREKRSLSVKIDDDGSGATWTCHRLTCGKTGGVRLHDDDPRPQPSRPQIKPPTQGQPDWLFEFFAQRRISAATVKHFGVWGESARHFPGLGQRPAIAFPYKRCGDLISVKYRPHPDKAPQSQEPVGATPVLFNGDSLAGKKAVIWVEGEPDVMAVYEAGLHTDYAIVSLRDGAKGFSAFETHEKELLAIPLHILAGDMDKPGMAWREEIARRVGRHRVKVVTWPEGCKDACDVLQAVALGVVTATDLGEYIANAQPWPIEGVFTPYATMFDDFDQEPHPGTMTTGTVAGDDLVKLPTDGRIIVMTGYPNHGKSALVRFLMVHVCTYHHRRFAVFSGEDECKRVLKDCASIHLDKPYRTMTRDEKLAAGAFLAERVRVIEGIPDSAVSLDWLFQTAALLVLRDGITDVVIDPWNEVDHDRGRRNETDYTNEALRQGRNFVRHHGCNLWIIAHPAKPLMEERKSPSPPKGYDIAGSAAWANKCDIGLTTHLTAEGDTQLTMWKSRVWSAWGSPRHPPAVLFFNADTKRYYDKHTIAVGGHQ
jgi:twinkle protein